MVSHSLQVARHGFATLELVVAIGILIGTLLPVAYSFVQERRLARAYYYRAVAMEIVDGEMEVLMAGEWSAFPKGRHPYPVRAAAATNLPPGQFLISMDEAELRLEWQHGKGNQGGAVRRVAKLPGQVPRGEAKP